METEEVRNVEVGSVKAENVEKARNVEEKVKEEVKEEVKKEVNKMTLRSPEGLIYFNIILSYIKLNEIFRW